MGNCKFVEKVCQPRQRPDNQRPIARHPLIPPLDDLNPALVLYEWVNHGLKSENSENILSMGKVF
jgi:hypothetical protein